ncbi:hypothetical protein FB451DRAFT_1403383 [Mycena latifolia]|nr:hypothetical protein FB451DRAFT_1403383 [Mycena latifolia]
MKLVFTSVFLALVQLATAQDYIWRLYNNGGCDHTSPAEATSPPFPNAPGTGVFNECITSPKGIFEGVQWNRLEVGAPGLEIITFCNANCGGQSLTTDGSTCAGVAAGCVIESFLV